MRKKGLLDETLKQDLIQDMQKRTLLESTINQHVDEFMGQVSSATIYSIMDLVIKEGHPQQKKHMTEVRNRYENAELILDDTLFLLDMFEKYYYKFIEDDEC